MSISVDLSDTYKKEGKTIKHNKLEVLSVREGWFSNNVVVKSVTRAFNFATKKVTITTEVLAAEDGFFSGSINTLSSDEKVETFTKFSSPDEIKLMRKKLKELS